jgi:predicted DNA-binding transcriptional regulator AlpA
MNHNADERWLSRQELADRYGLPVRTLAQWASKGTGPRYARLGRHARYRLSDVTAWEATRLGDEPSSHGAQAETPTNSHAGTDVVTVAHDAHRGNQGWPR